QFKQFQRADLSEKDEEMATDAIFSTDHEKRIFLGDVTFVIADKKDVYRLIYLKYISNNIATITAFDKNGNLVGKLLVKIKKNNDVIVDLDKNNPIGSKILEKECKRLAQEYPFTHSNNQMIERQRIKKAIEKANEYIVKELEQVLNFILTSVYYVLTVAEVKQVSDKNEETPQEGNHSSSKKDSSFYSKPTSRAPLKLKKIIYEGRQKPYKARKNKQFIKRKDAWKVRGHWRIYSDGKRVWVKPHVRGRKAHRYKPKGKDYRL